MIKNLKKLISTVAAVAMLASTASVFALDFPDVDESASYANSVEALTALGVVNGDDNGLFNPENTVTRAEFAKMTVEALGEGDAAASSTYTKFADTKGHWAAGYVEAGVSAGFINGYDEDNFGPDDTVQYAQAVKMLVGALGYDVYASKQGGWPSGYLSYGSSLDIINGVSVASNETELTRAQCAVLIFNAMKAPRCIVNGYDISSNGDYVPKYEVKDGDGKEWQTLLTKRNAYVVKGRVTDTSKTGTSLDEGEVTFKVENAENFDGSYYKIATDSDGDETGFTTVTALVGDTDAENMLFTYAEAVLSKDKYTGDWTIVSIVPYGKSETVEFAADDVDVDVDYTDEAYASKIAVFKSATSKNTVKYQLDATPNFYVNGVKLPAGATLAGVVSTYIKGNKTGMVTLVDQSKAGSTSVDGKYDHVMITSYISALVDAVSIKNDSVKISLKDYPAGFASRLTIDLEDEDREVTFVKDGKVISYEDLKEDEVLTIAYDPTADDVNSSKFVEVIVSDAQVSGIATGRSTADNTVTIDGEAYEFIGTLPTDLNKEYTLFIDAFGYVVAYEEGTSTKNIGVVVNMYRDADGETITASVVNGEGKVEKYEVKDEASALAIYKQVVNSSATALPNSTTLISKSVAMANVKNAVIEYSLPSGKLKYTDNVDADNGDDATLTYKEATSKLGSYTIADTTTKFVDLSSYASNNTVGTLSMDTFEDEFDYSGYVFDRNRDGVYNFVIITSGTTSLSKTSALAVVSAIGSETDIDGTKCTTLVVARNGEEEIEVSVENSVLPADEEGVLLVKEGSIIAYVVGSEGYVDSASSFKLIHTPADAYSDMLDAVVARVPDGDDEKTNFGNIPINLPSSSSSKPVNTYYGPVYSASSSILQLFTAVNGSHESNVNKDVKVFSLKDANVYTYDYSYKAGKGLRVSTGAPSQSMSIFRNAYTDGTNSVVKWTTVDTEDIEPMMAFVREVDGDVTDVVYFING